MKMFQHLLFKDLIARLHICEVEIRAEVGQESQKLIAQRMPEHQYPPGGAEETRAVDHIRPSVENGFDELEIFHGMVFQIRILYDDEIPRGLPEPGAKCSSLAQVF